MEIAETDANPEIEERQVEKQEDEQKEEEHTLQEEEQKYEQEEEEEEQEEEEDEEEEDEQSKYSEETEATPEHQYLEDITEALQPVKMYFPPTKYGKVIQTSSKCYIAETIDFLTLKLTET
ncbi:hypothetical protein Bca4012_072538 [Brassica carinata]